MTSALEAIRYKRGHLLIIDQLLLPHVTRFIPIRSAEDGWHSIKEMHVRGAPAIAIVAMLSLAVEMSGLVSQQKISKNAEDTRVYIEEKLDYLATSRPTAVNLSDSVRKMKSVLEQKTRTLTCSGEEIAMSFIAYAENMLVHDVADNRSIGEHGANWIVANTPSGVEDSKLCILTHCNTGSLATAGYGTALGIIRHLHEKSQLCHAYCTETRPYNQGARLTAYELVSDQIPATLITDSMAGQLLAKMGQSIAAIVVGADRVASNGDTANKIGTYTLAVLAKYHGVKFVVAAPRTTIDMGTRTGKDIVIEERPHSEVTTITGPRERGDECGNIVMENIKIAADGINVWNPAFDVTPAALIDAIVTEKGVEVKDANGRFHLGSLFETEVRPSN
ncbi:methylthioribose-1-phosphate isomerase [Coccidioides immitis RS]|uniref:Methylthioribose-1-phosphate isomerase n=5 Tax=Coccidioides TaxID=5500 RepID=MTNA_COCP7|nr:methylthioribose-1-phosphate isomerase [Coccidioides immitis RS]XP_003068154.1 methylthioribose-1-phosphate isomerase, putative [Coccidioides posadasii C735 delta SOWgp]C5PBM5.1 RecName: Full=Methylthioribose-1-phosphate isomerase; Short=M1Pi; Short=MTR-1-P isomerase; AltName: Full=S-methyl-5-thioribose-1-phosphate isomerase; AltName: Full=Translation initiation factor eIF-2B subunit alpha/beta/delta-like protein [Coccidioides posadasii C735 delta SOWgp]KMP05818.1 methylthioribose-1-phosphate|eukprot:XP_003068154.1 methylthioribose-1-phosphate isomerase, putative [Coccidioides posadasii C735 delta SOWgp]